MEKGHLGKWLRIQIWQQKKVEYHCQIQIMKSSSACNISRMQVYLFRTINLCVCIYHDKLLFILLR